MGTAAEGPLTPATPGGVPAAMRYVLFFSRRLGVAASPLGTWPRGGGPFFFFFFFFFWGAEPGHPKGLLSGACEPSLSCCSPRPWVATRAQAAVLRRHGTLARRRSQIANRSSNQTTSSRLRGQLPVNHGLAVLHTKPERVRVHARALRLGGRAHWAAISTPRSRSMAALGEARRSPSQHRQPSWSSDTADVSLVDGYSDKVDRFQLGEGFTLGPPMGATVRDVRTFPEWLRHLRAAQESPFRHPART